MDKVMATIADKWRRLNGLEISVEIAYGSLKNVTIISQPPAWTARNRSVTVENPWLRIKEKFVYTSSAT